MLLSSMSEILMISLRKILIFIGGIFIGILIVLFVYLIITIISNRLKSKSIKKQIEKIPTEDPVEIIHSYKVTYLNFYSNRIFKDRISSIKDLSMLMINDIAVAYYPESKNPTLEISLDGLLDLSTRVIERIDLTVSEIIDSKTFKTAWASYAVVHNIKEFVKGIFKKEKEDVISLNVRKLKVSFIINQLDKIRSKSMKKDKEQPEEKIYFMLDDFINNKLLALLEDIGKEAILVYSNNLQQVEIRGNK